MKFPYLVMIPALMAVAAPSAKSAVTFTGGGSTLTMTVSSLPSFTITSAGANTQQFGLLFQDVYTVAPAQSASGYNSTALTVSINGGPDLVSTFNFAYAADPFGSVKATSLLLFIAPFVNGSLNVGDTVKIKDFSIVLDNTNYNRNYTLPNNAANSTAYITNGGTIVSAPVAVPEASSALLGAAGALCLLRRRRCC